MNKVLPFLELRELYKKGESHYLVRFFLSEQQHILFHLIIFLIPTLWAMHNIAINLVFCFYDANIFSINTMIGFDYVVFHIFLNLMVQ